MCCQGTSQRAIWAWEFASGNAICGAVAAQQLTRTKESARTVVGHRIFEAFLTLIQHLLVNVGHIHASLMVSVVLACAVQYAQRNVE